MCEPTVFVAPLFCLFVELAILMEKQQRCFPRVATLGLLIKIYKFKMHFLHKDHIMLHSTFKTNN